MKKKGRNRVISALCAGIMLFSVLFFGSCTSSEGTQRSVELKLTTVEASVSKLRYVVEQFNKKNTEYRIKIEVLPDSSLKDYNFSHGAIETDFISFENFTFANRLSDLLQPLNRTEAIGKYQISLINHLKTDDGTLYVMPAPGVFSSQCLNLDLFESRNYALPTTIDELVTLAQRIAETSSSRACSLTGGNKALTETLMGVAVPLFGASVQGFDFLREFYEGRTTLTDGGYAKQWQAIFEDYRSLYRASFFSVEDVYKSNEEEIADFADGVTLAIHNSFDLDVENVCSQKGVSFSYSFQPFIGNGESRKWIAVRPRYYLGVTKDSYADKEKRKGINAFFEYYTSADGQDAAERNADGVFRNDSISFIKDFGQTFEGAYAPVGEAFLSGRVFLADIFTSVFDSVSDSLEKFLRDEMGVAELMKSIDAEVFTNANKLDEEYEIKTDFDYGAAVRSSETAIGNYTADAVRLAFGGGAAAVILPAGMIRANLFRGTLRESELSVVFGDVPLALTKITGAGLKKILTKALSESGTSGYPLLSGLRLEGNGQGRSIKLLNGRIVADEDTLTLLLPVSWAEQYAENILSIGSESSALALVKAYMKENGAAASAIDGRMGGIS